MKSSRYRIATRIIGILPAGFQFLQLNGDVWEPHTMFRDWEALRRARGSGFWSVVGRLRSNVTFEQAQTEMSAIARRLDEQLAAAEKDPELKATLIKQAEAYRKLAAKRALHDKLTPLNN